MLFPIIPCDNWFSHPVSPFAMPTWYHPPPTRHRISSDLMSQVENICIFWYNTEYKDLILSIICCAVRSFSDNIDRDCWMFRPWSVRAVGMVMRCIFTCFWGCHQWSLGGTISVKGNDGHAGVLHKFNRVAGAYHPQHVVKRGDHFDSSCATVPLAPTTCAPPPPKRCTCSA